MKTPFAPDSVGHYHLHLHAISKLKGQSTLAAAAYRHAERYEQSATHAAAAVDDAIERGAVGFDAIKHLVLCRIERRPPRLDLGVYPYLPRATVATTSTRSYMDLLARVAAA